MRKIKVDDYQKEWKQQFSDEADILKKIFKEELVDTHHIGSTAVEGLKAKPVIDIMPVVTNIEAVNNYNKQMIANGYEPKGENGLLGRRFYQKGGDNRTHHVHIYEKGNPEIERHLAFRDYLQKNSCVRVQYGELKKGLVERNPYNINAYIKGKEPLVKTIERDAIAWRNQG